MKNTEYVIQRAILNSDVQSIHQEMCKSAVCC